MEPQGFGFFTNFMPHGHCYAWQPDILWTNVLSDLIIAASYFSIPIALVIIVKKRKDVEFKGIFYLFSAFILFCGITHLFSIVTIWNGFYGTHGVLKAITAVVSLATAITLFLNLEHIINIPSREGMLKLERARIQERLKREELELRRKSDELFRFSIDLQPNGLLVINQSSEIVIANKTLAEMFDYEADELSGERLEVLLDEKTSPYHHSLVQSFIDSKHEHKEMAAGRVVKGVSKKGKTVWVQIKLVSHPLGEDILIFASVQDMEQLNSDAEYTLESSNRLKRTVYASNDGLWEWNLLTNDVWFSPQFKEQCQLPEREQYRIDDFFSALAKTTGEELESYVSECVKQKKPIDFTFQVGQSEGALEWVRLRGECLYDANGKAILLSGTLSNINELKQLEEQLEKQNKFLNEVLSKTFSGIYLFDFKQMQNIFINETYTEITGYTLEDLGKIAQENRFMELFHPDDLELVVKHQESVMMMAWVLSVISG